MLNYKIFYTFEIFFITIGNEDIYTLTIHAADDTYIL